MFKGEFEYAIGPFDKIASILITNCLQELDSDQIINSCSALRTPTIRCEVSRFQNFFAKALMNIQLLRRQFCFQFINHIFDNVLVHNTQCIRIHRNQLLWLEMKINNVSVELLKNWIVSDDAEDVRRIVRAQEVQPCIKLFKIIMFLSAENIKWYVETILIIYKSFQKILAQTSYI